MQLFKGELDEMNHGLLALIQAAMQQNSEPDPKYLGRRLTDIDVLEAFEPVFKAVFGQELLRYSGSEN